MVKTTRFYDSQTGQDGPVSGALQIITLNLETAVANSDVLSQEIHFPAGMAFEITDITVFCGTVTDNVTIKVGSSDAGSDIVASVALATGSNALTIAEGTISAAGMIDVTITADATGAVALPVSINVTGYVTAPPTSAP